MKRFVVSFYDSDQNKELCKFYTEQPGEIIKWLHYCKKYNVEFTPRTDDEFMSDVALDRCVPYSIDDYFVKFGSDPYMQIITVILT